MTDDFREDALTDEIRGAATRCLRLRGSLTEMAEQVRSLELDVLIYPELGMHHRTFALGALRLAPIQCAGWGHPVTTGHEAMDYFISCAAMEPPDGQSQYSERLVMLPGIGTSYRPFSFEGASSRNTLGLPEDAHLYFYPHSAFKIHPESDDLVGEVLAEDPAGLLVTFAGANAWVDEDYLRRVHAVFARKGIGSERIIRFPMTSRTRYLKIAAACDVMLDTVYWSGGNTTLDALTVGLPLVTLPGATMRSRQSMGMLGELELRELIAVDRQSYVRIGVSLGRDRDWRESISRRIAENRHVIFEDPRPVAALGAFLSSVG